MNITVDTNVLISATFWAGASRKIIDLVESGAIELVLSREILDEFMRVLTYEEIQKKIEHKNLEMRRTVEQLVTISTLVEPRKVVDLVKEDPDDNKILSCALEGAVDYIVSQDSHLLSLKFCGHIPILRPEEFLLKLEY